MNVDVRRFVRQNALSLRSDLRTQLTVDSLLTDTSIINPRTNMQIHTPTLVQESKGGGGKSGWNSSWEFLICSRISKRFYL